MTEHKKLASGGWNNLTLPEQLANIGSEVERTISWQQRGDMERSGKAMDRALELIDMTIGDERWKGRLKELCRIREIVCDTFLGVNTYDSSFDFLRNYFLYFGILARKSRV